MDKKILFGGAAALIMGAGLFAAPASASIEYSWGGDAKLTATFSDTCQTQAAALTADDPGDGTNTPAAFATFLGLTYTPDAEVDADQIEDLLDALTGGTTVLAADASMTGDISFVDNSCSGSAESPVWATSSKLEWSAEGTLANGLSVSADQDAAITLGGAFGSITFKDGGDSAAKASFAAGDGDLTVAGSGFSGHALSTAGTAGYVVTYQAPSVGGMDLYLSYAPNSEKQTTDGATDYVDTIGFGASFGMDAMTISAGWESATANTGGGAECDYTANVVDTGANITASALINKVYGTDECGDMTLMVIGAAMDAGGISFDAGWSELDTEEADRTTTSINLSTSAGGFDVGLGWVNSELASKLAGADTTQTAIAVTLGTSLGDGVDLSLNLSNNEYDDASQTTARGGNGPTSDFLAEAELKISY